MTDFLAAATDLKAVTNFTSVVATRKGAWYQRLASLWCYQRLSTYPTCITKSEGFINEVRTINLRKLTARALKMLQTVTDKSEL